MNLFTNLERRAAILQAEHDDLIRLLIKFAQTLPTKDRTDAR